MIGFNIIYDFPEILTTVSKVCKVCVLQLGPSSIGFIFSDKAVNGGAKLWCEIQQVNSYLIKYLANLTISILLLDSETLLFYGTCNH